MEARDKSNENVESNTAHRISVDQMNNRIVNADPTQCSPPDSAFSTTTTTGTKDDNKDVMKSNMSSQNNINAIEGIDKTLSNSNSNSINLTNKNIIIDINNVNINTTMNNDKVTVDRNTSAEQYLNNTSVDITNNNDSCNRSTNVMRTNSFESNIDNKGLRQVTNDRNTLDSSRQEARDIRVNVTNNNIFTDNSNHEITNSLPSNSINCKSERKFSSDTFQSTTYDSDVISDSDNVSVVNIQVPIVGYEVMEERARFTVFKLKVEDLRSDRSWLVFRRYTDFVRLYTRLKSENVHINLPLPGKRWFKDNFEAAFLEERVRGLQVFINTVIRRLGDNRIVREFLCVEEPPGTWGWQAEAIAGALQDTVSSLRRELAQRDHREETLLEEIKRLQEKCANCQLCNERNS